ncbi:low temperature requirement protein A [Streptomyces sp. NPDC060334]|uniref:low temperature requirement protein A n=1 Tax=unclassified Streptomyces TaxID=2593676 RepID=UPI0006C04023|nr:MULTISPECIES: low temperature requirement protein A [unclassified Streptomyces]KOU52191.1 membrane protein [Streptomyces sp. WM4235]MCX5074947.1 low temperature requirement protein A [Streptomyces sp. NBC_00424]MCX5153435.1 low temperature requirement protein A [Streptomyces sp. NBC_00291]WUD41895.1 low temperature requirement protein A [Streptomyces sp. NBC_00513]
MTYVPMTARSRDESHRAATPLELFFDLCFVVGVAQAGRQLVHALAEGHVGSGITGYLFVFFGVWWAWMNFTWFASAYDVDDIPYRIATLVQISGVLVYSAGIPRAFNDNDWTVAVIGYLVMRIALTFQWLRAAAGERGPARRCAITYAVGLLICQAGWTALLLAPESARQWLFLVMVVAELAVPVIAEHGHQTPWHPHHIAERYGLFTIIVLGETIAASTVAVQSAIDEHEALGELLPIAAGGLLLVFAAWWIYFAVPVHEGLRTNRDAIPWGYGHFVILASAAAIGAGIEVAIEQAVGKAHVSDLAANLAVAVPAALFLLFVWFLHSRHFKRGMAQQLVLPISALAVLACSWTGEHAVLWIGLVAAATVAVGVTLAERARSGA